MKKYYIVDVLGFSQNEYYLCSVDENGGNLFGIISKLVENNPTFRLDRITKKYADSLVRQNIEDKKATQHMKEIVPIEVAFAWLENS